MFRFFLSVCGPNFVENLEFKNSLRMKLKSGLFQLHFKYRKNSRTIQGIQVLVVTMRFEPKCFSDRKMKEMKNRKVGGK